MAKLFSDELEALIQITTADGVLSELEKSVLIKKATDEGVDLNELDVYVQYILSQKQNEVNQARLEKAQASKVGAAKKCPNCGGVVPELVDVCPHCNELIKAEADKELVEIIDNLEDALVELKSGEDLARSKAKVERYSRKAKLYYENNAKVKILLAEIETETAKAEKKGKAAARKNTAFKILKALGTFIMSHKLLSFIIILAICGGLSSMCSDEEAYFYEVDTSSSDTYEKAKAKKKADLRNATNEVTTMLRNGNLDDAVSYLQNIENYSDFQKDYDQLYLNVFRALVTANKFDDAEILALSYKTKIGYDYYWSKTGSYQYLKVKYKERNKDFSMLQYE